VCVYRLIGSPHIVIHSRKSKYKNFHRQTENHTDCISPFYSLNFHRSIGMQFLKPTHSLHHIESERSITPEFALRNYQNVTFYTQLTQDVRATLLQRSFTFLAS